ncbi:MAG: transporter permease [Oscillospiraceae bacterium]|nr:transporter permease [Oscillospiraceae bacterium]
MKNRTIWWVAIQNLRRQKFQSVILTALLTVTALTVFFSASLAESMKEGLEKTKDRLGADIIVVPNRFVSSIEDALFLGKPCTVNFDKSWLDKISAEEGVEQVSYQLYLSSLNSDCCETSMQLIAFDINSDFAVAPWLSEDGIHSVADDEIIVGSSMNKKVGDVVKYFGRNFTVIDVLEETGMGYDSCAFISYEAAYQIANDPDYDNVLPFQKDEEVISMVLVKLKEGDDSAKVKEELMSQYADEGIAVYTNSDLVGRFSDELKNYISYATIFQGLFLLMAVIALYGIYSVIIHLRKAEFGTYFSFGTEKKRILLMLLSELLLVAVTSTAIGIGLVCLITIPFHEAIRQSLSIPYLRLGGTELAKNGAYAFCTNLLVCALASVKSYYSLARLDGIALIKSSGE